MTAGAERGDEKLVCMAADAAIQDACTPAYMDARFAEWLVRDAAQRAARRLTGAQRSAIDGDALVFAQAMESRVMAARMARKYPRYALRERSALVPGTFAQTGELAAQERCAPRVDLRVAAGVGRELWDEACDAWVELPSGVAAGAYVALTVSGDSMTPFLREGDVIVVNPRARLMRDSVIVAHRPDEGYVVKYVTRVGRGEVELASLNPVYAPFTIARGPGAIVGTIVARLEP